MSETKNALALRVVREILDAAQDVQLDVAGVSVTCTVSRKATPRPMEVIEGLDAPSSDPWPSTLEVDCKWPNGRTTVYLACSVAKTGTYKHRIALRASLRNQRILLWASVALALLRAPSSEEVRVEGWAGLAKRKTTVQPETRAKRRTLLRDLVASSGLAMIKEAKCELFRVRVADGAVLPSPQRAFESVLTLALYKLDFTDNGIAAKERGAPIIAQVPGWGEGPDEDDDEGTDAENEGEERRYWAGGFGEPARLAAFLTEGHWQVGWSKDDPSAAARRTWKRLAEVTVGDRFVIKGYGGKSDLQVHLVGAVKAIDLEQGRLTLEKLDVPLYKGKAPKGAGAGSFFDTLVPVTRPDIIELLFGKSQDPQASDESLPDDGPSLPLNLILYGPPGTGKTYRLLSEYQPRFGAGATHDGAAPEGEPGPRRPLLRALRLVRARHAVEPSPPRGAVVRGASARILAASGLPRAAAAAMA